MAWHGVAWHSEAKRYKKSFLQKVWTGVFVPEHFEISHVTCNIQIVPLPYLFYRIKIFVKTKTKVTD